MYSTEDLAAEATARAKELGLTGFLGGPKTISASRIRKLCAEGRIPAEKVGRDWIIRNADAQAWIEEWLRE